MLDVFQYNHMFHHHILYTTCITKIDTKTLFLYYVRSLSLFLYLAVMSINASSVSFKLLRCCAIVQDFTETLRISS